ncbi:hypothetical protein RB1106 [Rhodopirellula baltica SH 1]|uniref:Uncharacterized protein n=1 Tax=Rhodopirellula baltica (strain DSM 10527 / NCIMB 13988 / SH1) TaxID=243090 RepID=Q7UXU4_RHOBA|nr:hypothetical protein RB1106 [Rhodopirellula baltica SH 1]
MSRSKPIPRFHVKKPSFMPPLAGSKSPGFLAFSLVDGRSPLTDQPGL